MAERTAGIDAKIERAKKHVRDYKKAEKRFFEFRPYKVVAGNEQGSGDLVYVLQGRREPRPARLSVIAGDAYQQHARCPRPPLQPTNGH